MPLVLGLLGQGKEEGKKNGEDTWNRVNKWKRGTERGEGKT